MIDQAIGAVEAQAHCDADEAFERLRVLSQNTHRKLRVVAESVVEAASAACRCRSDRHQRPSSQRQSGNARGRRAVRTSRVPAGDQVKRRQRFGRPLGEALGRAGLRQIDLAKLVGTSQPSVSAWVNGRTEPSAATVLAIERCLGLTAGTLSGALGYLPVEPGEDEAGIEDVIAWSVDIDAEAKEAIIAVYRVLSIARTSRNRHSGNSADVGTGVMTPAAERQGGFRRLRNDGTGSGTEQPGHQLVMKHRVPLAMLAEPLRLAKTPLPGCPRCADTTSPGSPDPNTPSRPGTLLGRPGFGRSS